MTFTTTFENLIDLGGMIGNISREYSPISMNREWSWLWRLFILILFTGAGTINNALFVATFFVSRELKKKGNIFLGCLGFTDLIITALVAPCVIVVMLSQIKESTEICQVLQFLTQWSTYAYSLFYMLVALDIYARLVRGFTCYRVCITYPFGTVAVLIFFISFVTAGAGVHYGLDYDYCNRKHYGDYWFRLGTSVVFYVIPCVVTIYLLLYTSIVMKSRVVTLIRYKRYQQFEKDKDLTYLHLGCYMFYVTAWIPYLVLVNLYPNATDANYYSLIWIGLLRSAITSFLYSALNQNIREAFHDLFIYICCKGELLNNNQRNCFYSATNGVQVEVLDNVNSPRRQRREPPIQYVM